MPGEAPQENQSEKVIVYLSPSLLSELDRLTDQDKKTDDDASRSKVMRRALREYIRRRPAKA